MAIVSNRKTSATRTARGISAWKGRGKADLCPPGLAGYLAELGEEYLVKLVREGGDCKGAKEMYPVLEQLCECIIDPTLLNSSKSNGEHCSVWISAYMTGPTVFLSVMRYLRDSYITISPLVRTLREKPFIRIYRTNSDADPYDENDPRNQGRPFKVLDVRKATAKDLKRYLDHRFGPQNITVFGVAKRRERFAKCNVARRFVVRRTIYDAVAQYVKDPKLLAECHRQLSKS